MIIGFMSTVGGAGTTFITTNIAAWNAQNGSTVVTEWGQDNIVEALYMREKSLNHTYPTTLSYMHINVGEPLLKTPYGLSILPGAPDCKTENFIKVVSTLKEIYKLVVIDLGKFLNAKYATELCDLIYLITEPTNECMQSLSRYNDFLAGNNSGKINLIVNKISSHSYYHPRDIARYLNIEEYTALPYEPKHINKAAANRQQIVYYSKGKCCSVLRKIAEDLSCKSNTNINSTTCVIPQNINEHKINNNTLQNKSVNLIDIEQSVPVLDNNDNDRDFITGCLTRSALEQYLKKINSGVYSIAFCDIDNFKLVNDTYGHAAGDQILHSFGVFLQEHKRDSDHVFRYGGDEFVLVLSSTNLDGAKAYMDRLSSTWSQKKFPAIGNRSVSLSGGIAQSGLHGTTPDEVLKAADEAMYLVKRSGRGSIKMAHVHHAHYSARMDTHIKQVDITTATERLIGIWGDGTKNILELCKPGRKTVIIINADPENQSIAFQTGVDMGLLWKHDWRLGLNAEPFKVNSKVYLYCIDYSQKDIESRDFRALGDLIKKHLEHKKERIVVNMGFNQELKNILNKFNGVIVGGDFC